MAISISLNLMDQKNMLKETVHVLTQESLFWIQNQKWLMKMMNTNSSAHQQIQTRNYFGRCSCPPTQITFLNIWMVVLFQTIKLVSRNKDDGSNGYCLWKTSIQVCFRKTKTSSMPMSTKSIQTFQNHLRYGLVCGTISEHSFMFFYGNVAIPIKLSNLQTATYDPNSWYWTVWHIDQMAINNQDLFGKSGFKITESSRRTIDHWTEG